MGGDEVWLDVVECIGSSQGVLGTTAEVYRTRDILVRRSTGVCGELDVLLCGLCGAALADTTWAGIGGHYRSRNGKDHNVDWSEKQRARLLFEQSRGSLFAHATQWNPPLHPIAPIEGVPVVEAYRCGVVGCRARFVLAGATAGRRARHTAWREHHRTRHGSSEFGDRGRPPVASAAISRLDNLDALDDNGADGPWGPLVRVQRLFARGPYHEVRPEPSLSADQAPQTTVPTAALPGDDDKEDFALLFADLERHKATDEGAHAAVIPAPGPFVVDEWHRYIDFLEYLQRFNGIGRAWWQILPGRTPQSCGGGCIRWPDKPCRSATRRRRLLGGG